MGPAATTKAFHAIKPSKPGEPHSEPITELYVSRATARRLPPSIESGYSQSDLPEAMAVTPSHHPPTIPQRKILRDRRPWQPMSKLGFGLRQAAWRSQLGTERTSECTVSAPLHCE